jgi:hypothetical protein
MKGDFYSSIAVDRHLFQQLEAKASIHRLAGDNASDDRGNIQTEV